MLCHTGSAIEMLISENREEVQFSRTPASNGREAYIRNPTKISRLDVAYLGNSVCPLFASVLARHLLRQCSIMAAPPTVCTPNVGAIIESSLRGR